MLKSSSNIKNSIWNLANILFYPAAFLGATPFFINYLGEAQFGIWMLVNSYVFIAVHIGSFGFGNSITAYVAEALGKDSHPKLHAYIHSATALIFRISATALAIAALWFVLYLSGVHVFESRMDLVLVIATLVIAAKFWEVLHQGVLKGFERYDKASFWNIISKFLVLGAQIALVFQGFGLLEIFISNLVINVVMVAMQGLIAYRIIPAFKIRFTLLTEEKKDLYQFGFWTWLQTIAQVLAFQIDRFIIAIFLGPAIAGYYILASTIANHMHMAFTAVVSWLFPKIARKKESNDDVKLYFHTLRGFSVGFSLLLILISYFIYEPVFLLWLGEDKFAKMGDYFALFLAFESILIMTIVPLLFLNGIKRLKFITGLVYLYKMGTILGMVIAFSIVPTAESLIMGQIIALAVLIPLEFFLVNKKILNASWFGETVVSTLPALLIATLIVCNQLWLTISFGIAAIVIFRVYYLKRKRFQVKLLLE